MVKLDQGTTLAKGIFPSMTVRYAFRVSALEGRMDANADDQYYAMRAQQELDMAALATDPNVKALHLNMAAEYAALREQAGTETSDARNATHD